MLKLGQIYTHAYLQRIPLSGEGGRQAQTGRQTHGQTHGRTDLAVKAAPRPLLPTTVPRHPTLSSTHSLLPAHARGARDHWDVEHGCEVWSPCGGAGGGDVGDDGGGGAGNSGFCGSPERAWRRGVAGSVAGQELRVPLYSCCRKLIGPAVSCPRVLSVIFRQVLRFLRCIR
ncbi:hypothetical protein E2C01_034881 [Portunus trituberculatus]|uniref:Uncharacterized protein n=1 Tax=Portunus trituberculatus TaxID=210409 RepID=A0A5B7F873_PORTR|nr:hypothetical protein [Portunus trituberculatus]